MKGYTYSQRRRGLSTAARDANNAAGFIFAAWSHQSERWRDPFGMGRHLRRRIDRQRPRGGVQMRLAVMNTLYEFEHYRVGGHDDRPDALLPQRYYQQFGRALRTRKAPALTMDYRPQLRGPFALPWNRSLANAPTIDIFGDLRCQACRGSGSRMVFVNEPEPKTAFGHGGPIHEAFPIREEVCAACSGRGYTRV